MDSDEEEMAELRTNARYGIGPRKPASAPPESRGAAAAVAGQRGSSAMVTATSKATRATASVGPAEEEDDESSGDGAAGGPDSTRSLLPLSFGHRKEKAAAGLDVHEKSRRANGSGAMAPPVAPARKGGSIAVHFGSKLSEASAVGAQRRQSKASTEQPVRSLIQDGDGGKDQQMHDVDAQADVEMHPLAEADDPVDVPEPGREAEALPVSHEVVIPSHHKAVTALSLDPKGARMITGSMDGNLRFFDFGGMNEEKQSFRNLEPVEGHLVQSVSFSTTGSCALVVCSDAKARIYDRDGSSKPIQSTVKGDMYVRDMQHTKGHTQMLTDGVWHPIRSEAWLTASLDGTLRLWDIHAPPVGMDQTLPSVHVLKTVDKRNVCVGGAAGRSGGLHPCCCAFSPSDGRKIVGGCSDGSVQLFFEKARYQKADRILRTAHDAPVLGVSFFGHDDNFMATRSADGTLKVWDCRMLSDAKGPLKTFSDMPANHEKTTLCASPDGRYVATGTSFRKGEKDSASLLVYDTRDMSLATSLDFGKRSVIRLAWPAALNQIVVGTSVGEVVMLYSPFSSTKGAMHFVGKRAKKRDAGVTGGSVEGPVFNMTDKDDIQKFYSTGHGNMFRIRRSEARANQKTLIPERPPQQDVGRDNADFQAAILKAGATRVVVERGDSQKALLAYDDKAKSKGLFLESAYAKTQPKRLLDYSEEVSEGDKRMQLQQAGDFCRKCGMKLCRCVDYSIYGAGGKKPKPS